MDIIRSIIDFLQALSALQAIVLGLGVAAVLALAFWPASKAQEFTGEGLMAPGAAVGQQGKVHRSAAKTAGVDIDLGSDAREASHSGGAKAKDVALALGEFVMRILFGVATPVTVVVLSLGLPVLPLVWPDIFSKPPAVSPAASADPSMTIAKTPYGRVVAVKDCGAPKMENAYPYGPAPTCTVVTDRMTIADANLNRLPGGEKTAALVGQELRKEIRTSTFSKEQHMCVGDMCRLDERCSRVDPFCGF